MHSVLPRAYLAPLAMGYLSNYYEEVVGQQQSYFAAPPEEPYARPPSEQRVLGWAAGQPEPASPAPRPLDLSLKPPPTPGSPARPDDCEPIEVDDEEDRRSRERARSQQQQQQQQRRQSPDGCGLPTSLYSEPPAQPAGFLLATPPAQSSHLQGTHALTPPSTPSPPQCPSKRSAPATGALAAAGAMASEPQKQPRAKKKHVRKLKFDEDKSSPVSGTIILSADEVVEWGDIHPEYNLVDVSPEARAELAKIENKLGPYQCKLCKHLHEDAFQLAQHPCSYIVNIKYRCPDCEKRFSCPANLASHRRWHKPKPAAKSKPEAGPEPGALSCGHCELTFGKPAALKKHVASQHPQYCGEPRRESLSCADALESPGSSSSNSSTSSGASNLVVDVVAMEMA